MLNKHNSKGSHSQQGFPRGKDILEEKQKIIKTCVRDQQLGISNSQSTSGKITKLYVPCFNVTPGRVKVLKQCPYFVLYSFLLDFHKAVARPEVWSTTYSCHSYLNRCPAGLKREFFHWIYSLTDSFSQADSLNSSI